MSVFDGCDIEPIVDLRQAPQEILSRFFYSKAEHWVILSFFPLILLFGLVGNMAFIVVLMLIKEMQTITNFYLANLAVADLIFLATQVYDMLGGYILSRHVKTQVYQSPIGCGLLFTNLFMSHFASVGFVVLVSLERYLGICRPLQHRMVIAKGRTAKFVTACWVFGLIYSVTLIAPQWFVLGKICVIWPDEEQYANLPSIVKTACLPIHEVYTSFPHIALTIPYTFALVVNSYMYFRIVQKLSTRVRSDLSNNDVTFDERAHRVRNQVARLLIVNGVVFFLCHMPYFLLRFNDAILGFSNNKVGIQLTHSQWWVSFWTNRALGTCNSVINPVIYSATNRRYRKAFIAVLTCRWNSKSKSDSASGGKSISLSTSKTND